MCEAGQLAVGGSRSQQRALTSVGVNGVDANFHLRPDPWPALAIHVKRRCPFRPPHT